MMKFFEIENTEQRIFLQAKSELEALACYQAEANGTVPTIIKEVDGYHVLQKYFEHFVKNEDDFVSVPRNFRKKVREGTALLLITKK
jgi:hypothetical protein